ncbi:MAG TPA: hypothetical protein VGC55_12810 [Dokdonella sp.]
MSIGGGGGGGILGAIGSIVGGIFGGPIGAMIGQMVGQLVQSVAGQALQEAGQQLGNVSQQGMQAGQEAFSEAFGAGQSGAGLDPSNLTNSLIAGLGGGTPQQTSDVHNAVDGLKKAISDFVNQFMQDTVQNDRHGHHGGAAAAGGGAAAGAAGGAAAGADGSAAAGGAGDAGSVSDASSSDSSGDDFFIAMAKGLGKAMQKQADKVKALSEKVGSGDDKEESKTQTQLMGESSKMQFLGQAVQTALSAVGQALGTLARKE